MSFVDIKPHSQSEKSEQGNLVKSEMWAECKGSKCFRKGERETTILWSHSTGPGERLEGGSRKEETLPQGTLVKKHLVHTLCSRTIAHYLSMSYQVPIIVTKVGTQYSSKNLRSGEDCQLQTLSDIWLLNVTFPVWIILSICSLWDAGQMAWILLSQFHHQRVVVKIKWGNTCAMTRTVPST